MRLRSVTLISLSIPMVMILLLAAIQAVSNFQQLRHIKQYLHNHEFVDSLSDTIYRVSQERSTSYFDFSVYDKVPDEDISILKGIRDDVDIKMKGIIDYISQAAIFNDNYLGEIKTIIDTIQSERSTIDSSIQKTRTNRDLTYKAYYLTQMNTIIAKLDGLYKKLAAAVEPIGSSIDIITTNKEKLVMVLNYLEQDATYILTKIANKEPWNDEAKNNLSYTEERIQVLWYELVEFSKSGEHVSNEISDLILQAHDKFFLSYFDIRRVIIEKIKQNDMSFDVKNIVSIKNDRIAVLQNIKQKFDNQVNDLAKVHEKKLYTNIFMFISLVFISILITFLNLLYYFKKFTNPLNELIDVMMVVSNGEISIEVPYIDRKDEVGGIAQCIEIFKKAFKRANSLVDNIKKENDNKMKGKVALDGLLRKYLMTANSLITTVNQASNSLEKVSKGLSNSIVATNDNVQKVKNESSKTAMNVDAVASAAEELSASIRQISEQMIRSADAVKHVVIDVQNSIEKVNHLHEASNRIGEVVQIIQNIAQQTNLLALNATIEAARAGDAGKGFGVVANEVKTLANQTAKATDEITMQVEDIQKSTEAAVKAIHGIDHGIKQVNEITNTITNAVDQQNLATSEISKTVFIAAESVRAISNNMLNIGQNSEEVQGVVGNVSSSSSNIDQIVKEFEQKLKEFITNVDQVSRNSTNNDASELGN